MMPVVDATQFNPGTSEMTLMLSTLLRIDQPPIPYGSSDLFVCIMKRPVRRQLLLIW